MKPDWNAIRNKFYPTGGRITPGVLIRCGVCHRPFPASWRFLVADNQTNDITANLVYGATHCPLCNALTDSYHVYFPDNIRTDQEWGRLVDLAVAYHLPMWWGAHAELFTLFLQINQDPEDEPGQGWQVLNINPKGGDALRIATVISLRLLADQANLTAIELFGFAQQQASRLDVFGWTPALQDAWTTLFSACHEQHERKVSPDWEGWNRYRAAHLPLEELQAIGRPRKW